MSKIRIRSVETSNISALIELAEATNLSRWSAQSYIDELKDPRSVMYRLESEENSTIGFIVGRVVPAADDANAIDADIYNIAVTDKLQNKGYGQILLDEFLAKCLGLSVRSLWLEVRESNANAIKFYKRNGFFAVTTRKHFYTDPPEHALLMRLNLAYSPNNPK